MRNAIPFLQADIVTIRDTQSLQWDAQKLQQRQTMLDWLSPTDFPAQQHDIISRRQEDTGQWFIDSPEFQEWSQGANRTLFCPGIPGAGKTMMTAIAIDHLCRTVQSDNVEIAYLFCSYKAKADQSVFNLLTALLKQLVQSQPDMATPVTRMYDYHTKKKSRPSLSDIFEALQSVCSNQTTVYILVDALDECADTDGGRGRLIDKLCELQTKGDLRLMLTSRFIPEVTERFRSSPSLEVRASDSDVRHFIDGHIPRLPKCIQRNEELQNLVQDKIAGAVDGMFLLARLHVDSLLDKRNKQSVMSTLEKLTKGSAALEKAYGEAIKRIDGQLDNDRSLARCALSWITYAQRPLTTRELCHALAIEPDDKTLNNDSVDDVEDVISVCAGLVTVDEESNVIRLVHYTTQEYFERIRLEWNPSAQEAITVACLTYLSFDAFRSGSCANDRAFAEKLTENAFYDYSARYWSEHIRPVEKTTSSLALAFLCDEALVDAAIQAVSMSNYKYEGYSTRFPNQTTGMHLAARYGLLYLTEKLLVGKCGDIGIEADSKDSFGRTSLSWAAARGHEAVVRLLVERDDDVDPNSKDLFGRAPLSAAAVNGYEGAVALLLTKKSIEPGSQDMFGRTPLSDAVKRGYLPIVELLLQRLKGQGNPVTKQELPAVRRPTVDPKCRIFCSICLAPIPDFDSHHHCGICDHGDFDMCEDCLASGAVCTDLSHTLAKRTVREGVLVNVTN
ncbi:ankyrin [Eremomyces bilateralis CBS 781.70]|uniref:Ankyrin n=1 Tax=Eremomyces bilateralis CBS 781.70 TaxID=1392243 RepID=A0A6G1G125_9PEZI|nr:ankyrin [Eremomyces bilateralis CBS 781.70]KAF1811509.1 ankyrin [Eremomyces bilateralis CBS 781.70]